MGIRYLGTIREAVKTVRKERDYYQSSLSFEIGCSITSMADKISQASSTDLLDCYGPTNRLIKLLEKLPDPTIKDRDELRHYKVKRDCLHIELHKRLKAFDHFKQRLDADKTIRETLTSGRLPT